ncbi:MAG: Phr family secreted Rap phosphatase inhibitor, partial [Eubacteriales bacterium]
MKKILSGLLCLVLAAVLMFSFVSCGEDDVVTPPPTGDTTGGENGGGTASNSTPKVSEVLTGVSAAQKDKDAVTLNA